MPTKPKSRISKQREIEIRKRKKRKALLITTFIMVVLIGSCTYLLNAETFKIQEIKIEGNKKLENEQIEELSEINIGKSIFSITEVVTKVKLKRNGYVENVKLEKTYPNKIKIVIEEREKKYQIETEKGRYIYIDEQGHILEVSEIKAELPIITGMEITEEKVEELQRLEENDLDKMEKILHLVEEIQNLEIENAIAKIETEEEYIVHMQGDQTIINLGDASNLSNRMFYVKAILKEEGQKPGTIYVNGNINEQFTPYFSAN